MHILESFALNTGLKIEKPYIYEKYVPLPFSGDYITFQPFGKYSSRNYDYWGEVTDVLAPILKENNIKIIQLGLPEEERIDGTVDMRGKTDYNQAAYLINHGIMHFGADTFSTHIASGLNKKIVSLYANMLPSNCGPYWSDKKDYAAIEPHRERDERPCYCMDEFPKTINKIHPETITKEILKFLNIKFNYPYKTIFMGLDYPRKRIELVPKTYLTNWRNLGVDSLIVRMDKHFDLEVLQKQLQTCPCSVVTEKPIPIEILRAYRKNIVEYVIMIEDDSCIEYIKNLKKTKYPFALVSELKPEKLNKIKLKLIDYGTVISKSVGKKSDIKDILKGKNLSNVYYKNSNLSVIETDLFPCNVNSPLNKPIRKIKEIEPQPIIDHPDFWKELHSMILLEKA
jgi:hypothetical protein